MGGGGGGGGVYGLRVIIIVAQWGGALVTNWKCYHTMLWDSLRKFSALQTYEHVLITFYCF